MTVNIDVLLAAHSNGKLLRKLSNICWIDASFVHRCDRVYALLSRRCGSCPTIRNAMGLAAAQQMIR